MTPSVLSVEMKGMQLLLEPLVPVHELEQLLEQPVVLTCPLGRQDWRWTLRGMGTRPPLWTNEESGVSYDCDAERSGRCIGCGSRMAHMILWTSVMSEIIVLDHRAEDAKGVDVQCGGKVMERGMSVGKKPKRTTTR